MRRLMREHDLQAPQRAGHAHGPKAHVSGPSTTSRLVDVMWGTGMTAHRDRRRGGTPSSSWPPITARPRASGSTCRQARNRFEVEPILR